MGGNHCKNEIATIKYCSAVHKWVSPVARQDKDWRVISQKCYKSINFPENKYSNKHLRKDQYLKTDLSLAPLP